MTEFARRSASLLNGAAALWAFLLAVVILIDVVGRAAFDQPFQGAKEIVANSIVAIVFLQFPLAVQQRALLRTTLVYERIGTIGRRGVDSIGALFGALLFGAMAIGGWEDMVIGWRIGEFEGEGAMRVPVYPVRTVIVIMSALCSLGFIAQVFATLTGARSDTGTGTPPPSPPLAGE